ncbi:MAG TPA: trypsin-like peptidase domain-containing protein [Pirellulales bacterium]|nr:trypsin-like peptidase domain-containing protein [Pirellulales bacterium]
MNGRPRSHAPWHNPRRSDASRWTRRAFGGVAIVLFATCGAWGDVEKSVLDAESERVAVIAKAQQATIAIFTNNGQGGGSGVVISADGYALTNFHVVAGAGEGLKCGMSNGELYDAVVVGIDPVGDVALIQLFGRDDFPAATFGDSDEVRAGDWVFVIGNPFLLATDFRPTVTYGIVSGVHRYQYPAGTLLEYADCIQTDASINPGNSGGPLFDSAGRLIGINGRGSFEKRGRVNVGVGYAISLNQIKKFMGCLRSGRIVDHATLGARVASQEDGRVVVTDILETSDAFRRGLRYGDELLEFGGRSIQTVNGFKNILGTFPKGWRVPLSFRRRGERYDVFVRLAGVHGAQELIDKVAGKPAFEPPGPKPKPSDKPEPKDDPKRPMPLPKLPTADEAEKKELPEVVKQHRDPRRGYANYYYNRLNRDRVWQTLTGRGDFTTLGGEWLLRGRLLEDDDTELRISDHLVACTLPGGPTSIPVDDDLAAASDPPASGGLLAALYVWRRLLVKGPTGFGNLDYYGSLPLPGHPGMVDMLIGAFGGVESHFLVDSTSGHLLVVELYLGPDDDPCELHFTDYRAVDGRDMPSRMLVRYGDNIYGLFTLTSVNMKEQVE